MQTHFLKFGSGWCHLANQHIFFLTNLSLGLWINSIPFSHQLCLPQIMRELDAMNSQVLKMHRKRRYKRRFISQETILMVQNCYENVTLSTTQQQQKLHKISGISFDLLSEGTSRLIQLRFLLLQIQKHKSTLQLLTHHNTGISNARTWVRSSHSELIRPRKSYCRNSRGSVTKPVSADAAAVYGEARYICPSLWPMRPGKFLFVVDTQTCILPMSAAFSNRKKITYANMYTNFNYVKIKNPHNSNHIDLPTLCCNLQCSMHDCPRFSRETNHHIISQSPRWVPQILCRCLFMKMQHDIWCAYIHMGKEEEIKPSINPSFLSENLNIYVS